MQPGISMAAYLALRSRTDRTAAVRSTTGSRCRHFDVTLRDYVIADRDRSGLFLDASILRPRQLDSTKWLPKLTEQGPMAFPFRGAVLCPSRIASSHSASDFRLRTSGSADGGVCEIQLSANGFSGNTSKS